MVRRTRRHARLNVLTAFSALLCADPLSAGVIGDYLASKEIIPQSCDLRNVDRSFCSATLISADTLLTAAHCEDEVRSGLREGTLRAECKSGQELIRWPSQRDPRQTYSVHPDGFVQRPRNFSDARLVKKTNAASDLLIIRIPKNALPRRGLGITPISRVTETDAQSHLLRKNDCRIVGWGADNFGKSGTPHAGRIGFINIIQLDHQNEKIVFLGSATFRGTISVAAGGDSGGSLVCRDDEGRDFLVGVISASNGASQRNSPAARTHVSLLADEANRRWIESTVSLPTP